MAILGQPPFVPRGIFGKVFLLSIAFYFTIIVAAYTANLAAFLTTQQSTPAITGYDDLQGKTVGVLGGSSDQQYVEETGTNIGQIIYVDSIDDLWVLLLEGTVNAVVVEQAEIQLKLNSDCRFVAVGQMVNPSGLGIPVTFSLSDLIEGFDTCILSYQESGYMAQESTEWFGSGQCGGASNNGSLQLGVGNFWGLYIVVAVFIIFGAIADYGIRALWKKSTSHDLPGEKEGEEALAKLITQKVLEALQGDNLPKVDRRGNVYEAVRRDSVGGDNLDYPPSPDGSVLGVSQIALTRIKRDD